MAASDPAGAFLPTTRAAMDARGWSELDVLMVTGDAYVDHPSFGPVLIARWLEALGYRVGVVAQPRWDRVDDLVRMGRPRLFVGVSAGNVDSMLAKLTAQKKPRSDDPYSPDRRPGRRPDRATIVYSNLCRRAFGSLPIVLGGIEASLRRLSHYDYWSDSVRRSVLLDAKADLLVYGMGERAVEAIAAQLARGEPIGNITNVRGTAYVLTRPSRWQTLVGSGQAVLLPSHQAVASGAQAFLDFTRRLQAESNPWTGRAVLQSDRGEAVCVNPPSFPLDPAELDRLYELPFTRSAHPAYGKTEIVAATSIQNSVVIVRGCSGGCSFCSLTEHAGRVAQSRSPDSLVREIRGLVRHRAFRGTITDLGGPTANHYQVRCRRPELERRCRRRSCLHPRPCRHLATDHGPLMALLSRVRQLPGVRHVYLASGIRHDLALLHPAFIEVVARHHTGGQLSVAPEHVSPKVLALMHKPSIELYTRFAELFAQASARAGREQYLVPYLLVGHPGSTLADTLELALYLKRHRLRPRQVQEFIPTPMSWATAMYHTGLDPASGQPVPVTRGLRDLRRMKALSSWWDPAGHELVREALRILGREDLIGRGPDHLVPPGDPRRGGRRPRRTGQR